MKSNKTVLHTAVLGALLVMAAGAQAGNLATTTRTFATEDFGPTQAATVAITPAAISYSISNPGGVTVANTQTVTLYLRLSGTNVFSASPAVGQFSSLNIGAGCAAQAPTSVTWAAGATAGTVAVTYPAGASCNLPINTAIIYTPAAGAVTATSSALATAGGTVTVTGSLSGLPANNAATTLPADQDPVSAPATIANSATAVTGAVTAAQNFATPETAKINLSAVPSGDFFTVPVNGTTTQIDLGSFAFTNNAAIIPTTLGGANYVLGGTAAAAGAIFTAAVATVAPNSGASIPVGATLYTSSNINCTGGVTSNIVTWAAASTSATLTLAGAAAVPGTGLANYICMTVPGTVAITPVTPTAAVSLTKTVATDAADTVAATSLYPLSYNGSQKDVRSYIPVAASGYTSFVRVINTGSIAAPVSVAVIDGVTGTVGTSAVLGTVPALGATTFTSAQIEAVTGAITSGTARPRLRFTAPTNGMDVQSFILTNANGNFSDATGAQ